MKRLLLLFLLLNSVALMAQNDEFRATWVVTWEYINSASSVAENKARIIRILDEHKKANMNAVLWQVRQSGTAYYNSSYEPWGQYAGYVYPGFDPLAFVIEEAHKRGMEVHAWFNTFMISSNAADRVTGKHPDWICTMQDGTPMSRYYALSPGIKEVRDYTLDVAMEIVNNYDIDGIHLDYIRWNEYTQSDMTAKSYEEFPMDGMISESRLANLKSTKAESTRFIFDQYHPYSAGVPAGFSSWDDWRRASVTEFVKMVHDSIQLVKPWVRLSTSVLGKYMAGGTTGWNGYYVVFQDGALWFNQGYIDHLTPMHYHWYTGATMQAELTTDWEPYIAEGIADRRLYSVGPASYLLESNNIWGNHPDIVNSCRNKPWVDGFQFFSYASWHNQNYWEEAGNTFFSRMSRIRPVVEMTPPAPPTLAIEKIDQYHYSLTVTPSAPGNCWYIIYRSEDATFDPDGDEIVYTIFNNAASSFTDAYDGLQSFNGKYSYFAVAYNRYRNGSLPSDPVITDDVPSLPPVVKSVEPSEGETAPVNTTLIFTFSKEMNTASMPGAFTTDPAAVPSFTWSADSRNVTVRFPNKLSYDTQYTVTLGNSLTDVNGTALDGNGDGTPGDVYVTHFRTELPDITGPVMTSATVADQQSGVDVSSVFSFAFDEVIKESSVVASCITLKNNSSTSVPFSYAVYRSHDSKGIISVKPDADLSPNENYTLTIDGTITDTVGNAMGEMITVHFKTSSYYVASETVIEEFNSVSAWWKPSDSGSTTGIFTSETSFSASTLYGLPSLPSQSSGKLAYAWDAGASTRLIREYCNPSSAAGLVAFDSTYTVQVYLFGDSSNNKFRFCLDEGDGTTWSETEVSTWKVINWHGWKLVEWKLSDPASVGSWLSLNNTLTGPAFRTDSYQLTTGTNPALTGTIYLDRYRAVNKDKLASGIDDTGIDAVIARCYPNPSSASSVLYMKTSGDEYYSVNVYNISGVIVETLCNGELTEGDYRYPFGSDYKPGVYIIEIRTATGRQCLRFVRL